MNNSGAHKFEKEIAAKICKQYGQKFVSLSQTSKEIILHEN